MRLAVDRILTFRLRMVVPVAVLARQPQVVAAALAAQAKWLVQQAGPARIRQQEQQVPPTLTELGLVVAAGAVLMPLAHSGPVVQEVIAARPRGALR